MTKEELEEKLKVNNVPETWYSLNKGLKPDALILTKAHSFWEFFYLSEKGDRSSYEYFLTDEEAYEHLWKEISSNLRFYRPPVSGNVQ
ncbi:hypothetical protein [Parabacteroides sp. FAFU027]|uniref:hypothetical protein n=1 Tax=Parabacteroides sp. FAFU027 TaxID=2922715 RepID=UPI001FAE7857|nr:hypothetical protein [Parabacteroides sp. FAFU027]